MIVQIETTRYALPNLPMSINVYWMTALHWEPPGTEAAPSIWRKHCWPGMYYKTWPASSTP